MLVDTSRYMFCDKNDDPFLRCFFFHLNNTKETSFYLHLNFSGCNGGYMISSASNVGGRIRNYSSRGASLSDLTNVVLRSKQIVDLLVKLQWYLSASKLIIIFSIKHTYLKLIIMSSLQKSVLKSKLPPPGVNFGHGSRLVDINISLFNTLP